MSKIRATVRAFREAKGRCREWRDASESKRLTLRDLRRIAKILWQDLQGIWYRHPWDFVESKWTGIFEERLGHRGRMISGSKSTFLVFNPHSIVVFNANVCLGRRKVWYGDVNLTEDMDELISLARWTGKTVSVLYERDGRFENERRPMTRKSVCRITSKGDVNTVEWDQYLNGGAQLSPDGKYRYPDDKAREYAGLAKQFIDVLPRELLKFYGLKKERKNAKKRAKVVRRPRAGKKPRRGRRRLPARAR